MLCYRQHGQRGKQMIKFTEKDNNKQFISIEIKDHTPTKAISENLK